MDARELVSRQNNQPTMNNFKLFEKKKIQSIRILFEEQKNSTKYISKIIFVKGIGVFTKKIGLVDFVKFYFKIVGCFIFSLF